MTGEAYAASAEMAKEHGPAPGSIRGEPRRNAAGDSESSGGGLK